MHWFGDVRLLVGVIKRITIGQQWARAIRVEILHGGSVHDGRVGTVHALQARFAPTLEKPRIAH